MTPNTTTSNKSPRLLHLLITVLLAVSFVLPQASVTPVIAQTETPQTTLPPGENEPVIVEQDLTPEPPLPDNFLEEMERLDPLYREHMEAPEERVYIPPSEEVIAKTKEQVDSFSCSTVTDVPLIECQALVALYASTNGAGWTDNTNWLITPTVDEWFGITVIANHVGYVELFSNNLIGPIPTEIGNLSVLQVLYIDRNKLTGSIPLQLGNLSNLQYLYLQTNTLSGTIPTQLGNLSNLKRLEIGGSGLTGSIPSELGNLYNLQHLVITGTGLTGVIPPELGNLSNLQTLYLEYNQLSGSIPPELGNLSNLVLLYLFNNQLTGSIPSEFGNLANLGDLQMQYNELSGPIPPEIGNLNKLGGLNLWGNRLSGTLPPELGNMTNLHDLLISDNYFEGSIPLSFTNLVNLDLFGFHGTSICEPDNSEFLAWKSTVQNWAGTGITCPATTPWLIMYYLDGDNNLGYSYKSIFNYIESGTGNPGVTITLLWDQEGSSNSAYYLSKHDSNLNQLAAYVEGQDKWQQGELNMGDPAVLKNFIDWSISNYPAEHYAVILDDHGSGLGGAMQDDTSNDLLSLSELKTSFEQIAIDHKKIDVLVMNACLMGLVEDGYQFRNSVDYYVASEELQNVYYQGYANTLSSITQSTTPRQAAKAFVDGYANEMVTKKKTYTMSVSDLSKSAMLKSAIDGLATELELGIPLNAAKLLLIREGLVKKFSHGYIDLYDFARLIRNNFEEAPIKAAAQEVMSVIEYQYIVHNKSSIPKAHGVSIFFPDMKSSYYNGDNYDFAINTEWSTGIFSTDTVGGGTWGNLLVEIFNVVDPDGPDDPLPPEPLTKDFPVLITNLNYNSILAGSPGFTLNITGNDFIEGDQVYWNGNARPTTFVSSTQLRAEISAAVLLEVDAAEVTVVHAGYEDYPSNSLTFTVYSFADVLPTHPLWRYVEGFFAKGITTGCATNPLRYCPDQVVTRGQMAVFLLRAKHVNDVPTYVPTDVEPDPFADPPKAAFMEPWIEQFYAEGYTTGCAANPLRFCPEKSITRGEMAVFLLRAKFGSSYVPVDVNPDPFVDPPKNAWMEPWIEQFYKEGFTTGCSGSIEGVDLKYCPEKGAGRAEMATFIDRVFLFPTLP